MLDELVPKIIEWGDRRSLLDASKVQGQTVKLAEEVGELAAAICRIDQPGRRAEAADAIGDIFVVITLLAEQLGFRVEECVAGAYRQIAQRDGKIVNNVFVKSEDL